MEAAEIHESNPKRGRKMAKEEGECKTLGFEGDRISELPDSLLLRILSLLPAVNEVIRTGSLSKRWQHLWTFVPTVVFPSHATDLKRYSREEFAFVVNSTLIQSRTLKIDRFSIQFDYNYFYASYINLWVGFATRNNVEDLALILFHEEDSTPGNYYTLPTNLFTCSSLKMLNLERCVVQPRGLISWTSLKSLSISDVLMSSHVVERILSCCPVLETLELSEYRGVNRLNVTSTSLRKFVLADCCDEDIDDGGGDAFLAISAPHLCSLVILSQFYSHNIRLENIPSLAGADLSFYLNNCDDYEKYCNMLQKLIEKLHHVTELRLSAWCIQVLSILAVKGLPSPLLRCKVLSLDVHIVKWDLPGIAKLLEISPYLETLFIHRDTIFEEFPFGEGFLEAYHFLGKNYFQSRKRIPECLLLHLKTVEIFGFRNLVFEFDLVKFLLKNARLLEKMVIHIASYLEQCMCCLSLRTHPEAHNLSSLPRSSPHAVVTILESP